MPTARADVILPYTSGLPRDVAINTFHFGCLDVAECTDLETVLPAFYNTDHGDTDHPIAYYISSIVSRVTNACSIKVYDVDEEGPPVLEYSWTLGAVASSPASLPLEVAACLSYRAEPPIGPVRRNRGRIYIGPLNNSSVLTTEDSGSVPVLFPSFCDVLAEAGTYLAYNSTLAAADVFWSVHSRLTPSTNPITSGWVDNEFDTQRRRQVEPTQRTNWTAVIP